MTLTWNDKKFEWVNVAYFGAIHVGALFAFSVSIDETVMSLFMQSPEATTLPVKMFTDIQFNMTPKIAVSSALLVSVATIGLLLQVMFVLKRRSSTRMLPLAVSAQT